MSLTSPYIDQAIAQVTPKTVQLERWRFHNSNQIPSIRPLTIRAVSRAPESSTITATMLWPVDRRVRYATIRERMTSEEGKRMRCIKGARHAHAVMPAEGRTLGDEGRSAIRLNRAIPARDRVKGKGWREYTDLA